MNGIIAPTSLALLSLVTGIGLAGLPPARAADAAITPAAPPPVIEKVPSPGASAVTPAPVVDRVMRGRYLVQTGGCGDCHTPMKMGRNGPEADAARLLSGHPQGLTMPPVPKLPAGPWAVISSASNTAWAGPWGVSFTANLTPDGETGLGRWTAQQFADTLRTGRHLGIGRPVLPPMPTPAYKNFNDTDLAAIFAYLQAIPPIKNRVPAPLPPADAGVAPKK
ncbi:MAG: diheme cytochrome c-553 [Caldimonas sp.]